MTRRTYPATLAESGRLPPVAVVLGMAGAMLGACEVVLGLSGDREVAESSLSTTATGNGGGADAGPEAGACGLEPLSCDATRVDPCNDADHCGRCGHDCRGGSCAQGKCEPFVLFSGQAYPWGIAVHGTYAYWTEFLGSAQNPIGSITAGPIQGGRATTFATTQASPFSIVVDATDVFWTNSVKVGAVNRCAVGGCDRPAEEVASAQDHPWGLAVDNDSVYWTTAIASGAVLKCPRTGTCQPVALGSGPYPYPTGVAVLGGRVFFVTNFPGGGVFSAPFAGGAATELASALPNPYALVVDAENIYFATSGTAASGFLNGSIACIPNGGGDMTTLASNQAYPSALAIDDDYVYFATGVPSRNYIGAISRVPKRGGAVDVLASDQPGPAGVALDATAVYWTNANDGTVMKVAK